MKAERCAKCKMLDKETGVCSRYNKQPAHVRSCGIASRAFVSHPFSRKGAVNSRKRWEKKQRGEEAPE